MSLPGQGNLFNDNRRFHAHKNGAGPMAGGSRQAALDLEGVFLNAAVQVSEDCR